MVPGRLIQLRFKTLLKKEKSLFFVVIEKDSREPKGFLRVKVKDYVLYLHPCSSSSLSLNHRFRRDGAFGFHSTVGDESDYFQSN
jgi:hypothetical protein